MRMVQKGENKNALLSESECTDLLIMRKKAPKIKEKYKFSKKNINSQVNSDSEVKIKRVKREDK